MINVARFDLCRTLFEMSGWKDTHLCWSSLMEPYSYVMEVPKDFAQQNYPLLTPAYDLGYLLRKLPVNTWVGYASVKPDGVLARTQENGAVIAVVQSDTPEDAAAKLATQFLEKQKARMRG